MRNLVEKLNDQAGRWLDHLDDQVQEPIVRIMTGEVWTHGGSVDEIQCSPIQVSAQPAPRLVARTRPQLETQTMQHAFE
jgi:hypothetical protein